MYGSFSGSVAHYLSGHCKALKSQLQICLNHFIQLLSSMRQLLPPVFTALNQTTDAWVGLSSD